MYEKRWQFLSPKLKKALLSDAHLRLCIPIVDYSSWVDLTAQTIGNVDHLLKSNVHNVRKLLLLFVGHVHVKLEYVWTRREQMSETEHSDILANHAIFSIWAQGRSSANHREFLLRNILTEHNQINYENLCHLSFIVATILKWKMITQDAPKTSTNKCFEAEL